MTNTMNIKEAKKKIDGCFECLVSVQYSAGDDEKAYFKVTKKEIFRTLNWFAKSDPDLKFKCYTKPGYGGVTYNFYLG